MQDLMNPKHEILNKYKARMTETQNCLALWTLVI
jgi:hypothetical protein